MKFMMKSLGLQVRQHRNLENNSHRSDIVRTAIKVSRMKAKKAIKILIARYNFKMLLLSQQMLRLELDEVQVHEL